MDHQELLIAVDGIHSRCKAILSRKKKNRELPTNRFYQFHQGAALRDKTTVETIADMMTKHTTQLYSMVNNIRTENITVKEWRETICDNINYLYIMLAAIENDQ